VTTITPRVLVFDGSFYGQRAGSPVHSMEDVMRNWWIPAICAGAGALIATAVGDLYGVSHTVGTVLAGAGAGIGAVIGSILATKASLS
jgi:hypothetical protein